MKSHSASDKKIFYGLVVLIVLTVLLIVGITYIQRPQTTSSDAQEEMTSQLIFEQNAEPTSIPLPDYDNNGAVSDQSEDNGVGDNNNGQTETGTQDQGTGEPTDSGAGDIDPTTSPVEGEPEASNEESASSNPAPTTIESTTQAEENGAETITPTSAPTIAQTSDEDEPSPTDTLYADSGNGGIETGTAGTGGSTITYTTSTPVPTAGQLPVAGTVHITLLIFAASLMLVVLGLAL